MAEASPLQTSLLQGEQSLALRSPRAFGFFLIALMFLGKLLVANLAMSVGDWNTTSPILDAGLGLVLFSFLLLPVETLLGQALPMELARLCRLRHAHLRIAIAGVVFGLLHFGIGPGAIILMIPPGVVLAVGWHAWRRRSLLYAFSAVTIVHAVHNVIGFTVYYFFFRGSEIT